MRITMKYLESVVADINMRSKYKYKIDSEPRYGVYLRRLMPDGRIEKNMYVTNNMREMDAFLDGLWYSLNNEV